MQQGSLSAALTAHLEAVAAAMQRELDAGAEIPFELESRGSQRFSRGPSLYCYTPLTGEFIARRTRMIEALPSHREAVLALSQLDGLDAFLAAAGLDPGPAGPGAAASAALELITAEVFAEQSSFELGGGRLQRVLARLESSAALDGHEVTLIAPLRGVAIGSRELRVAGSLSIVTADGLAELVPGAPPALAAKEERELFVVLKAELGVPREAIAHGRAVLLELLRALRLFGDGRIALGALGWARSSGAQWHPFVLAAAEREPRGVLVITPEQEDELRAFCNLISRRAPVSGALAWALSRFELGCERDSADQALTDNLAALEALLEPERDGRLAARLAALCALAEEREQLLQRVLAVIGLERSVRAGAQLSAGEEELARELEGHLRALLRDVICGHLDFDLAAVADAILAPADQGTAGEDTFEQQLTITREPLITGAPLVTGAPGQPGAASLEEIFRDPRQSEEILDVLI